MGKPRTYGMLILAQLFWAGNVVLGRGMRASLGPSTLIFWRWVIALAILLPLTWRELWRQRALILSQWKQALLLGFLGVFLYQALAYQALTMSPALNILLITASTPLVIALINWVVNRKAVGVRLGMGIVVSLLGVLVVVAQGNWRVLGGWKGSPGDLLMLLAIVVWGFYAILLQRQPLTKLTAPGFLTVIALAGFLFAAPFHAWRVARGETLTVNEPIVATLAYMGIFSSVLAYLFWNQGVAAAGANGAGLFVNLMPVFGASMAVCLLGETFAAYHVAGAVLVFGGIVLGIDPRKFYQRSGSE